MKVRKIAEAMNMETIASAGEENEVKGVYACDFLSRAMCSCEKSDAWITVLTHPNILTVAELNGAVCIIIPEGISVNTTTVENALEKNIPILSSDMKTYEICWKLHELIK